MKRFKITIESEVIVELDESQFSEEWLAHFKKYFYDVEDDCSEAETPLQGHAANLATQELQGVIQGNFLEGYGNISDMGIHIGDPDVWVSRIEEDAPE